MLDYRGSAHTPKAFALTSLIDSAATAGLNAEAERYASVKS